jgi:cell division protein FtsB
MADPKEEDRRVLYGVGGALLFLLVFGNNGFRQLWNAWRETRRVEENLLRLHRDRERLARELAWIQKDPSYPEYLVRKNLGYVKKGEVEYRFIKRGKNESH